MQNNDDLNLKTIITHLIGEEKVNAFKTAFFGKLDGFLAIDLFGVIPMNYVVLAGIGVFMLASAGRFFYTPLSLAKKIINKDKTVDCVFIFRKSVDGDGYIGSFDVPAVFGEDLKEDFVLNVKPKMLIDNAIRMKLDDISRSYRISDMKYNFKSVFGLSNAFVGKGVDDSQFQQVITEWTTEISKITEAKFNGMSESDKENLQFKYAALSVVRDVFSNGKDLTKLRTRSLNMKNAKFDGKPFLSDPQSNTRKSVWLRKMEEELRTPKVALLRSILLNDYFQAYATTTVINVEDVNYLHVPLKMGKETSFLVVQLNDKYNNYTLDEQDEVYTKIQKAIHKHEFGMKVHSKITALKKFVTKFLP